MEQNQVPPITHLKTRKEPLIVQGQGKTITILPETNKSITATTSRKNTKPETQFAFPEKYVEQPSSVSSCLGNMEPTQIGFDDIKCLSKDQATNGISSNYDKTINNDSIVSLLPANTSQTFLSTPDTLVPPILSTQQQPLSSLQTETSSQMSLVPVAPHLQVPPIPMYARQSSFKDR